MADIKLATASQGLSLNPWKIRQRRQHVKFVYEVALWLHNLALFSALDFERFDEERFWDDYRQFQRKYPPEKYPAMFNQTVEKLLAEQ
ncbi:hypothetical protein HER32_07375 [Hymenobacter sp. BT18]|uniref:hypothetical protein n=1 Tax=Hymenobacter sp. BT18 TaxID=2835648 RepID=UPI00143E5E4A|nr:hypothetical protein [Hymenobacter sp. BT18]QIX61013.1 hypothetical protein HER32_07375 [Hymenobacter sp. BT18]